MKTWQGGSPSTHNLEWVILDGLLMVEV